LTFYNSYMSKRTARRNELYVEGSLPQNTLLSEVSGEILLTADSLRSISNMVTKVIGRTLTSGEIGQLDHFIRRIPPSQFSKLTLGKAQRKLADDFIYKFQLEDEIPEENEDLSSLTHTNEQTDDTTIDDLEKAELMGLTSQENPLKYSMFHDRRGRAAHARESAGDERILRNRGTASKVLNREGRDLQNSMGSSGDAGVSEGMSSGKTLEAAFRSQQVLTKELLKYAKSLNGIFNAETIDGIFSRSTSSLITYEGVNLPHQVVPLDSRFRLVDYNGVGEYKWNVHTAGDAGRPGDIRMLDTLTQVMAMKICPFWIPVSNARYQYYSKIRMFIKEFKGQSVQVNEFLDGDSAQQLRASNFHFEFVIDRVEVNRIHLIPVCPIFYFRLPIAQVNTLTISFRSPFELIIFDPDRLYFTVSNTNPAVFTSTQNTNLATGDLVYVCGFFAGSTPALQAINTEVNNPAGYFITRLGNTQFSIPIDLSSLAAPINDVEVEFGSKRIVTQLEFISLEQ
jgi:hypothetical protein